MVTFAVGKTGGMDGEDTHTIGKNYRQNVVDTVEESLKCVRIHFIAYNLNDLLIQSVS